MLCNTTLTRRKVHPSGLLRSEDWYFLTDVPGQPIGPIFSGQESKKILKPSTRDENKFQDGDTCQLTCRDCGKKYRGHTAETLKYGIKNICIHLGVIIQIQNLPSIF